MKISVGILAGSRAQGLNCAKVKAGNRMNISKLIEELDGMGDVLISATKKEDHEDLCGTVMEDSSLLKGCLLYTSRYSIHRYSDSVSYGSSCRIRNKRYSIRNNSSGYRSSHHLRRH